MENQENIEREPATHERKKFFPKGSTKKFTTRFIPSLNRAIIIPMYCAGEQTWFGIVCDKKSSALQFQLDSNNPLIKKRIIKVKMYRNLEKCGFCNVFMNLKTETTPQKDFRSQFIGINPDYSKEIILFSKEMYNFNNIGNPSNRYNTHHTNHLTVSSWKLHTSDNDLIFQLVQRACFNDVTKMSIIRTAGLLLGTDRGFRVLEQFENHSSNKLRKVSSDKDYIPDFTDDDTYSDDEAEDVHDTEKLDSDKIESEYEYYSDDDYPDDDEDCDEDEDEYGGDGDK